MGRAFDLARLLNSSGQVPDAKLVALAAAKLTGQVPDANAPSGSVIQVVQAIKTDTFTTTSGSFVDVPGLSVNITPMLASNRILIVASLTYGGGQNSYGFAQVLRNSTPVALGNGDGGSRTECTFPLNIENTGSGSAKTMCGGITLLDSPATTSLITYKIQVIASYTGTLVGINRSEGNANETFSGLGVSTITVMEIAA